MLKVAFDATLARATAPWARSSPGTGSSTPPTATTSSPTRTTSARRGITAINHADEDLKGVGALERPSRILKVLWLMQQSNQVPTTTSNLARLLAEDVSEDLLALETQLGEHAGRARAAELRQA